MSKVPVNGLISQFQTMYKEHWDYVPGGSSRGAVDCSGAFVYAYRQYGAKIYHGSNTIARRYIVQLLPISEARPGMAAFKLRAWKDSERGNRWYGTAPGDLYHIGLVDTDPNYVLNAKGTRYGFSRDRISTWHYVAYLSAVDYNGGESKLGKVVLPAGASGSTVNMRKQPSKASALVMRVPVGSTVDIIGDLGDWCEIQYKDKTGYMMSNYLEYEGQDGESGEDMPAGDVERINQALMAIETAIGIIGEIVGRG